MNRLQLNFPSAEYKDEIMKYKREFIENGDNMAGTGGLRDATSFEEWYNLICNNLKRETVKKGLVPATTLIAISKEDEIDKGNRITQRYWIDLNGKS